MITPINLCVNFGDDNTTMQFSCLQVARTWFGHFLTMLTPLVVINIGAEIIIFGAALDN